MLRPWVFVAVTLLLFGIWSNSFIAMSYLLGGEVASRRLDWVALTVARFLPASLVCGVYCLGWRRVEAVRLLRRHWPRLIVCAALVVPGYNLALYYAQQQGVPAPIASLTTALVPLFLMTLAALFLGERLTRRKAAGFVVAIVGMFLVAMAKRGQADFAYPLLIGIAALAPLAWSVYTVLSKPLVGEASPIVWTYLSIALGGILVLPLLPGSSFSQVAALDLTGWAALMYLSLPCTVLGFALWTWLLRHMPASSLGFTVFLNPPMTMISKWTLSVLLPAVFVFTIRPLEWLGGGLVLSGLAIAVRPRAARRRNSPG